MSPMPSRVFGSWCLGVGAVIVTAAQAHQGQAGHQRYLAPIELFKNWLGTCTKPISTTNKEAQAFFDQGFQMMYSFAKPEAVRSFRESWKRDGNCAICYWGEAWAWGSYLNGPMTAEESPFAFAAAEKARALRDRATPKERALIDAIAVRYVKEFRGDRRMD